VAFDETGKSRLINLNYIKRRENLKEEMKTSTILSLSLVNFPCLIFSPLPLADVRGLFVDGVIPPLKESVYELKLRDSKIDLRFVNRKT
jgi:hypothetical protein